MNEVSLRNSVLDTIDELNSVVTESADDVLYSLLETADKAAVIMENCEDTDDVWKYSIWQEADENAIDKDKNPFKESSTLKTILMLPINLIRYIWKTISQAFNPQQVQETSKAAAAAAKVGGVVHKVLPFFFKEDGTLNLPVVIATGAGGAVLTLDGIIRKAGSIPGRIWRSVTNAIKRILVKIRGVKPDDIPDADCFKIDEKDGKFIINIDITKSAAFIDKTNKLIDDIPAALTKIQSSPDDKTREEAAATLQKNIGEALALCPVTKERKTYTAEELAKFYNESATKFTQISKDKIDEFTNSYNKAVGDTNKDKKQFVKPGKALANLFEVVNAYATAVDGIGKSLKNIGTINEEIEKLAKEKGVDLNNATPLSGDEAKNALNNAEKNPADTKEAVSDTGETKEEEVVDTASDTKEVSADGQDKVEPENAAAAETSTDTTTQPETPAAAAGTPATPAKTDEQKLYGKGKLEYSEGLEIIHAAYNGTKNKKNIDLEKSYPLNTKSAKAGLENAGIQIGKDVSSIERRRDEKTKAYYWVLEYSEEDIEDDDLVQEYADPIAASWYAK